MKKNQDVPWLRLSAESVAIVASILLAFTLDAWWEQQQESGFERVLLESLQLEFSQNISEIDVISTRHGMFGEDLESIRLVIRENLGNTIDLDVWELSALVYWTTSDMATGTVDGLLASGELRLLSSSELRNLLAAWPAEIADAQEDEILAREFIEFELTPSLLGQNVLSSTYLVRQELIDTGEIESQLPSVQVTVTNELVDLTTVRIRHERYAAGSLRRLRASARRILDIVEVELDDG